MLDLPQDLWFSFYSKSLYLKLRFEKTPIRMSLIHCIPKSLLAASSKVFQTSLELAKLQYPRLNLKELLIH